MAPLVRQNNLIYSYNLDPNTRYNRFLNIKRLSLRQRSRLWRIMRVVLIFWVLLFVAKFEAYAAPIYVIHQPDGTTRFTTKPPPSGVKAKVFTASKGRFSFYSGSSRGYGFRTGRLQREKYKDVITSLSRQKGVPEDLIRAVIHAESAFNPRAVSPKGAMGLMQLMPTTAKLLGVKDAFHPEQNIHGGVSYLSMLLKKFRGNVSLSLAAYNAGPEAVNKYGGIPPYRETRDYVQRVLALRSAYGK
ncbi:MAG: lytic transglycosylase domain-containing protein [Bdellovibrionales bacterium]|nr:lytic transglycosylase domain-containing protein [Bdellovibrionales bacterium]